MGPGCWECCNNYVLDLESWETVSLNSWQVRSFWKWAILNWLASWDAPFKVASACFWTRNLSEWEICLSKYARNSRAVSLNLKMWHSRWFCWQWRIPADVANDTQVRSRVMQIPMMQMVAMVQDAPSRRPLPSLRFFMPVALWGGPAWDGEVKWLTLGGGLWSN